MRCSSVPEPLYEMEPGGLLVLGILLECNFARTQMDKATKASRARKGRRGKSNGFAVVSPFPTRREATFKYVGTVAMTETAAGIGTQWTWALNGLYDPDLTYTGHQPMYFDQLVSALGPYYRYTVHDVQIKLTLTNMTANAVLCAYYQQPDPLDLPTRESVLEKPLVKYVTLSPNTGGVNTRVITVSSKIAKSLGLTHQKLMSDDQYSAQYNANPVQRLLGVLMAYSLPPSASVATVSVIVELRYKATLFSSLVAASQS